MAKAEMGGLNCAAYKKVTAGAAGNTVQRKMADADSNVCAETAGNGLPEENFSGSNKGFSLLELLVAVLVLAIVIIPLLHSFVSSYRVNARSREMLRATTLAQNEMELFEKEKLEDLTDPSKFSYRGWSKVKPEPESDGSYVFVREGTTNDTSGKSATFDVIVRLNPERTNDTDRYHSQNTGGLLYMNTISNLDCGSFTQPVKSNINDPNNRFCDETVYSIFDANKEGTAAWDFKKSLARTITLQISQVDDGTKTVTKAKVIYEYFGDDHMVKPGYQKYTKEQIIFDNAQEFDAEGNPIELKGIYLFYTPRYDVNNMNVVCEGKTYPANLDKIIVKNEAKLPVNVYLIRQDILKDNPETWDMIEDYNDWFDRNKRDMPIDYRAALEIHEYFDSEGNTYGNYYTNLKVENNPYHSIKLQDLENASREFIGINAITPAKLRVISADLETTNVKATETKDRIYTMNVEVYRHIAGQSAETTALNTDPLVVMDGSKLE